MVRLLLYFCFFITRGDIFQRFKESVEYQKSKILYNEEKMLRMANPSLNIDIILTNDINIRKKRFVRTIEEYSFVYKMPLILI